MEGRKIKKYVCESCGNVVSEDFFFYTKDIKEKPCKVVIIEDRSSVTFCQGSYKEVTDLIDNAESFSDAFYKQTQDLFDSTLKPIIVKEMKRLKIKSIDFSMGMYFFTLNNGKVLSDSEMDESTWARRLFIRKFINPLSKNPFYTCLNINIEITNGKN